jgi:Ca2+-binding EF-hand superfamily protein
MSNPQQAQQQQQQQQTDIYRLFTPEQIVDFRRTFDSLTQNRTLKLIKVSELGEVMRYIGFSPDEVEIQDLLEELQIPKHSCLDFEQFLRFVGKKFNDLQMRHVFRVFDQDGDGVISIHELRSLVERLGEKLNDTELMAMIKEADVDGDDLINFDDFSKIMRAP